ncbi:MAG: SAM-dependent methyltransferase [Actinomycetes bacterium]
MTENPHPRGTLTVVGTGIVSIGQLTLQAMGHIRTADIVCYVLAEPVTERWLLDNSHDAEDLSRYYDEGSTRADSYRLMASRIQHHVRAGRRVAAVFYGHPGVFVDPAHRAIRQAREEGFEARMLPGVSAEDCLFADLGFDPGKTSCETFEATEMLIHGRRPSLDTHVIIWQIGVVGNLGFQSTNVPSDLIALTDYLLEDYPSDHVVTHYQCAQYAVCDSVIQRVALTDLPRISPTGASTLYVPPVRPRPSDQSMAARLDIAPQPVAASSDELATSSLPAHQWYVPVAPGRSRIADLLMKLAENPNELTAYRAAPRSYLVTAGLDPVEQWAILSKNHRAIGECARRGSGPPAAVALGLATSEGEARSYSTTDDGRLMRPKRSPG